MRCELVGRKVPWQKIKLLCSKTAKNPAEHEMKMTVIFGGMALFTSSHFFFEGTAHILPKLIAIALLLAMAVWRKKRITYILLLLRFTAWFLPG